MRARRLALRTPGGTLPEQKIPASDRCALSACKIGARDGGDAMPVIEGAPNGGGLRVAVVVSRFNELITERLRDGAVDTAVESGVLADRIDVVWVPGAFELPMAAKHLALSGDYDAIACVGAVIRGETPHFNFVAGEAARGVMAVALETGVPVTFGVITSDNVEQARARAGGGVVGNKGREAMLAALEVANLYARLPAGAEATA